MVYIRKLRDSFKFGYIGQNLGQRRSKYGSDVGQNFLFENSLTNHGNFELKLVFLWYASENEDIISNLLETCFVYQSWHAVFIGPRLTVRSINLVL